MSTIQASLRRSLRASAPLAALCAGVLFHIGSSQPAAAAVETFYVTQATSLIFGPGSLNGDDAMFWPAFSEFDMGPVMSQDQRTSGNGSSSMAAYLNFGGVSAVEAQYSNYGTTSTRRAAFSQYLIGLVNTGTEAVPIGLLIDLPPGFARIDNGGGDATLRSTARLSVFIDANGPTFLSGDFPPFPQGASVWQYNLELVGPSASSSTNWLTNDVQGIGLPTHTRSVVGDSVIESVSGFNGILNFGLLQPGQKIAFSCNVAADVVGNPAGGHSMLGDPFGLIGGDAGAAGNFCTPQVVPAPAAGILLATALGGLFSRRYWIRRRRAPRHAAV